MFSWPGLHPELECSPRGRWRGWPGTGDHARAQASPEPRSLGYSPYISPVELSICRNFLHILHKTGDLHSKADSYLGNQICLDNHSG